MKRVLVLIFLCAAMVPVSAQDFPSVEAESLSGETVFLPNAFRGRYALIGIAGSSRAEEDLRSWQVPTYNKFIAKTGLMDEVYDVEVCFLPLFTGAMKVTKNKVVKKLKDNNEALVLDHVLVYAGDREPFAAVGVDDRKSAYFFLLDPDGRIVYRTEGVFEQRYFDDIEEILSR